VKIYINVCRGDYKLRICLDLNFLFTQNICFLSDCFILSGDVWGEVSTDK